MTRSIKQWYNRLLDKENYTLETILCLAAFLIIPHETFLPLLLIGFAYVFVKIRKDERKRTKLEDDQ